MYVFSISLFCSIPYLTFAVADPGLSRRGTPTHEFGTKTYYYWPQRSCGQVIFLHLSVILFTGGRVSASVHAGIAPPRADTLLRSRHAPPEQPHHPWADTPKQTPPTPWADTPQSRHTLGADTPWEQTPPRAETPGADTPLRADTLLEQTTPRNRHPPGADTPQEQTPPWEADSGIRSMSGRYASYWNAFLFGKIFAKNCMKIKEIGTRVGARVFSVPPPSRRSVNDLLYWFRFTCYYRPQMKLWVGNVFRGVRLSMGGLCRRVSVRVSLSKGVSVQGVSVQGVSVWGVSVQGVFISRFLSRGSLSRGLCPGDFCPGGFCPGGSLFMGLCPWVSLFRGLCPGGFCPGGSLSRWVSVQGSLSMGVSVHGGSLSRGLCPGSFWLRGLCSGGSLSRWVAVQGSLFRGVSVWGMGSLSRGSLSRGLCPGGSLFRKGVSVNGVSV